MKKMKNKILRFITVLMAIIFTLSATAETQYAEVQCVICLVAMIWIGLFLLANNDKSIDEVVGR